MQTLWNSRVNCIAVILFAVGFATLLLHRNLFKKILGLNIMDTASCLLLTVSFLLMFFKEDGKPSCDNDSLTRL